MPSELVGSHAGDTYSSTGLTREVLAVLLTSMIHYPGFAVEIPGLWIP